MKRLIVSWLVLLSGCGSLIEHATIQHRFSSQFGCASPSISPSSSGYHVEGCGQVADYACFDTDPSSEDPIRRAKPGHGRLLGAMVGSLLRDSMEVDTCVLAYRDRAPIARVVWSEPAVTTGGKTTTIVKTRLLFSGGSLLAYAKPQKHPSHVLLYIRSTHRMEQQPCTAKLFLDGVAVPVERAQRVDPYEVRMLVRLAHLQGAATSVRFAGDVCGTSFDLDDDGRAALGKFEARVREVAIGPQSAALARTTPQNDTR